MDQVVNIDNNSNKIEDGINFGLSLLGIPYDYWSGGINQVDAPMFAKNGPVPNRSDIVSANCAGLVNLVLRYIGKELPYNKDTGIGGTNAYRTYYKDVSLDFNIDECYPRGSLLIRDYRDINDQGHVAILLEDRGKDSLILQSHVEGIYFESKSPGVNNKYSLLESHNKCAYEYVVLPKDWLL